MNDTESLKIGDQVCISSYRGSEIDKVRAVTPKQIAAGGYRFWRETGKVVGDPYGPTIRLATPEDVAEVSDRKEGIRLGRKMEDTRWRQVDLDKLRRIEAILDETVTPPP